MNHCRVFMNSKGVDVPQGATVLDAVRIWDASVAGDIERGASTLTDSRGLPIDADAHVYGGAIFRVVAARLRDRGAVTPDD